MSKDKYHPGGIVKGEESRISKIVNKLFNVRHGEKVIKSLVGEIVIPPKNLTNGISSIKELAEKLSDEKSKNNLYKFSPMKLDDEE